MLLTAAGSSVPTHDTQPLYRTVIVVVAVVVGVEATGGLRLGRMRKIGAEHSTMVPLRFLP